ncbi:MULTISPECIES: hypothetical protein [Roseateles]|uniref:Uncharacterized protein n=1 Tax=Pelomonas aquatica TaxID=431058 RepID=A0ABU1Z9C4_9BURK|nr:MULTISPECIES: hypothetical protein [Roseateles]MDR7297193.1 hypothetical protein [Pelomonas aquatica]
MPHLMVASPTFYSSKDEASFFAWLQSISGITQVVGTGRELRVTLRSPRVGEEALRDLLALHWRYQLPMRALAAFLSSTNERWFAAPDAYWHDAVFGAAA